MPFVTVNGEQYYYRISKRAPDNGLAAICLHGSGADGVVWSYQLSRLSRYYKIIIPDLPGHGRSGGMALSSVDEYSAWLDRFTDELGIKSFFLFGHSFGGAIVQEHARAHADKIAGLVLAGTGTSFNLSRIYRELCGRGFDLSMDFNGLSESDLSKLPGCFRQGYEMLRKISNKALHADLLAAGCFDSSEWISSIDLPSLIIWGSQDIITPREQPEMLARCLPNSKLCIINGAGHVVMVNARDKFNALVKSFMDSRSPTFDLNMND